MPREQLFLVSKATSVALGMADPERLDIVALESFLERYLEAIVAGQLEALHSDYLEAFTSETEVNELKAKHSKA